MTTLDEATESVSARFLANYTGVTNNLVLFDNEEFENEPTSGAWVRVTVDQIDRNQDTLGKIGNRKFRSQAIVFVQVYTNANTGVQQGNVLAKQAADIFEGVSFSGLDFRAAKTTKIGIDGKWFRHLAEAPFDYDEIK